MNFPKIQAFTNKEEADKVAEKMTYNGWPLAHACDNGGYYIIKTHASGCKCGLCPYLKTDGYIDTN